MISSPSNLEAMAVILADHPELHWTRALLEDSLQSPLTRVFASLFSFAVFQIVADEAELLLIATAKTQQGQGHASCLLRDALTQLAAQGIRSIFLEVRSSNEIGQHLYEKLGFIQTGRRRDYYQDPKEDALLYSGHTI